MISTKTPDRHAQEPAQQPEPAIPAPEPPLGEAITYSVLEHYLVLMGEDGPEEIEILVETFLATSPRLLTDMHSALEAGDMEKLYRAVHNLKPNSASVGAMVLSERCLEFETMLRANRADHTTAIEHIAMIEAEYSRVEEELGLGKWNMQYPV